MQFEKLIELQGYVIKTDALINDLEKTLRTYSEDVESQVNVLADASTEQRLHIYENHVETAFQIADELASTHPTINTKELDSPDTSVETRIMSEDFSAIILHSKKSTQDGPASEQVKVCITLPGHSGDVDQTLGDFWIGQRSFYFSPTQVLVASANVNYKEIERGVAMGWEVKIDNTQFTDVFDLVETLSALQDL
jgi:hypothetical protein